MAEKSDKKKDAESVMANLPSTRPNRLSRHARTGSEDAPAAPKKAPAKRKAATAKAKAKAKPAATKAEAKPAAKAKPPRAQLKPVAPKATGPKPVRAGSPKLDEPARKADAAREDATPAKQQSGTELATTVVKAAGELAQIGATVAGQVIKRAVDKLPKP